MLNELGHKLHENSVAKGFWPTVDEAEVCRKITAMIEEFGEFAKCVRQPEHGAAACTKVPSMTNLEEEIADNIIRWLDMASALKIDIDRAVRTKHEFNTKRKHKHGKAF